MNYISTRGKITSENSVSSMYAIKTGLACDGGLFVPEQIPQISAEDIEKLCSLDYPHRAADVLSRFLTDYDYNYLLESAAKAYGDDRFVGGAAPLYKLDETRNVLELWHGPTCAFKDMALQIMPRLLTGALKGTGEKRTAFILVATSGDTGKAALEGYKDIDGIKITVFYPVEGVSRVQKLQMATQTGNNVNVCAIEGNFDDAQNGVKKIFSDTAFAEKLDENGYFLSSANSINWGRLAPQIVYYISAYCDLVKSGAINNGDYINVTVPTGNFGNILAAYYAKLMGLKINKLVCASNSNNVLTDFLRSGTYDRNRKFYTTMSPSMDILISSNLERLLYLMCGAKETAGYMKSLAESGKYTVGAECLAKIRESFEGYYCDEAGTAETIKKTFDEKNYLIDTHTAVAVKCADDYISETGDAKKMVIASTASPYKFAVDVLDALTGERDAEPLESLAKLSKITNTTIPAPLSGLDKREVRFNKTISKDDMLSEVAGELQIK
ncbi:MAG: threonine synthase [Ruminococcaceae bacterium]|nr:threonine synthase [Oscillospiraceae bacterium]